MKKGMMFSISSIILALSLFFVSCNNKSNISGIWEGTVYGYKATVTITASEWSISIPEIGHSDSGTFTRDGDIGNLYSSNLRGGSVGNAVLKDRNTITITLNSNSVVAGAYSLTRKNGNASESISKSLIGKWEIQKIIEPDGEEITFPGEYFQHGGSHYEKNGYTTYINGHSPRGFRSAYTKGNKFYYSEGISEWSIKNGILTIKDSDENGGEIIIQKKVEKFSWE